MILLASVCAGAAVMASAAADSPPIPDYFRAYGTAQSSGVNIFPEVQPVIAFANGRVCGAGSTSLVAAAEGTPASDVGKTAYVVDVQSDHGSVPAARGCGHANDPVLLYFPASQRVAIQRPLFAFGAARTNVELAAPLQFQLRSPQLASDGVP